MKKKVIVCLSLSIVTLFTTLTTSFAWFLKSNMINTGGDSGIDGSMFTGYFHCGSGTQNDPYVITRPKHWENLIWLHNNVDGFYNANGKGEEDKGFYFQVGYNLDGSGSYLVYEYDDDGNPLMDGEVTRTTTTLNLTCFNGDKSLIPLGSPKYPFIGEMDGKNLTVRGFSITSTDKYNKNVALEDIGIFGYVGPNGKCHNIYFNDYTINTDGAAFNEDDTYQYHVTHKPTDADPKRFLNKEESVCVGMLAGHINYAKSFENVYINNCTIDRPQLLSEYKSQKQLNTYGYYGYVEYMESGQSSQIGDNYSFTLDSQAVYDYFRNNFNTINNLPLRARYSAAETDQPAYTEYSKDEIAIPEYNEDGSARNPFSNGVKYITSGLNTYNLQGIDPQNPDPTKTNYSLSTLGYQPIKDGGQVIDYTVYAQGADGQYNITPNQNTDWNNTKTYDQLITEYGHHNDTYGYYNASKGANGEWEYYVINTEDQPTDASYKIKFTCIGDYQFDFTTSYNDPDLWSSYSRVFMFVDGVKTELTAYSGNELTLERTYTSSRPRYHMIVHANIERTVNLSLTPGKHHIAFSVTGSTGNNNGRSFALGYASSISDWSGTGDNMKITIGTNELNVPKAHGSSPTSPIELTLSTNQSRVYSCTGLEGKRIKDNVVAGSGGFEPLKPSHDGSAVLSLRGYNANDETYNPIDNSGYKFSWVPEKTEMVPVYDDDGNIVVDEHGNPVYREVVTPAHWNAHYNTPIEPDYDKTPVYIADDPAITGSGYQWENIDVVGGGVRFSNQIFNVIPGYITIDGETDGGVVKEPKQEDMGQPFYATKYCPSSIVMYLKNIGGMSDTDILGKVIFDYALTLANTGLELKSMIFKKGYRTTSEDYNFIDFDEVRQFPGGARSDFQQRAIGILSHQVEINIRRGALKRVSYVALNKDRTIIASYDADGNIKYKVSNFEEKNVATYVICLGVHNHRLAGIGNIINTRITRIQFDYVAKEGFGGSFGPVEFRISPYTVTENYFSYYFYCPSDDKYRVRVHFVRTGINRGRYFMYFDYYSETRDELYVNLFLTNFNNFTVYINCADESNPQDSEIACDNSQATIYIPSKNF